MNPNFEDPNNHVPEATPGDSWGDGEEIAGKDVPADPVPLPPKRGGGKKGGRKKKSALEDPKNHVPEVTSGDGWGDERADGEGDPAVSGQLPPKREAPKGGRRKKAFEDPKNHVPEAAEADDWGGSEKPSILPKKRQADEKPAGYFQAPEAEDEKGIEIGVRVIEKQEVNEGRAVVQRLEVQEHVPKLLAPEVPVPPKVVPKQVIERTAEEGDGVPAVPMERTAESESWGTAKKTPLRWIVISIAALGICVLAGVLLLPRLGWKNEDGGRMKYSNLEIYDTGPQVKDDELSLTDGIEDKAKKVAEAFVAAKSVDDVLPLVRDRERLEPVLRERWKPLAVPSGWTVPDNSEWSIRKAGDREFGFLSGMYPDITPFRFYIVQKGDQAFLDWEASTAYCETLSADLVKRKGPGGVTRCLLSPGDFYTYSMPEEDYQCFRLASSDGETVVWGYVKKGDPLLEDLVGLFVQGAIPREIFNEYAITLRLAPAPGESLPNQWLITEKLYLDWISP